MIPQILRAFLRPESVNRLTRQQLEYNESSVRASDKFLYFPGRFAWET
ncbi:MAG: hypothetical protein IJ618_10830 [Prevotella sp.]|nr:hypothetical protein [Prevotella sp.]